MHLNEGISRTPEDIRVLTALTPRFDAFDNTVRGHAYYLKFTGQTSPNHQVSLVTQNELYDESQDVGTYASPLRGVSWGGPFTTARVQSVWGSSLTTTATVAYNTKDRYDYTLHEDLPGIEVNARVTPSGGRLAGTGRIALLDSVSFPSTNEPLTRTTIDAGVTYYRLGVAGSHEIKAGLYFIPRNRMRTLSTAHGGGMPTVFAVLKDPANPAGGYTPYYRVIYDSVESEQLFLDTRNVAVYVQDAWRPTSRLTINAGVRVDNVVRNDRQFSTTVIGAGSNTVGFREEYDLDLDGTFETAFVTPGRTALSSDRIISDDYHQPYIREWTVGYQRQMPGRVTVEANVMRRAYRDYPVGIDTNGIYDGNVFVGYANPDFNQITWCEWGRAPMDHGRSSWRPSTPSSPACGQAPSRGAFRPATSASALPPLCSPMVDASRILFRPSCASRTRRQATDSSPPMASTRGTFASGANSPAGDGVSSRRSTC